MVPSLSLAGRAVTAWEAALRVLMLSWEYPPHVVGGLGKHVWELTPALVAAGVEVHLVTPRYRGGDSFEEVHPGLTVHRVDPPGDSHIEFFSMAERTNIDLARKAREIVRTHGPFDLIHAHDWLVAFASIDLKHEFKLPLLATIHATEYGRHRGYPSGEGPLAIHNTEWWLTFEAWRVITCTDFMRQQVITSLYLPANKIDIIPNGVDTTPFDRLDGLDLSGFRSVWAAPDEAIVFNVGRMVYEKGAQFLVEAAPRVLLQRPNTRFIIAGTGPMEGEIRDRVGALGLTSQVTLAGFLPDEDRDKLFRVSDAAIFPSLYEPFGIVALEAMAARVPVITSNIGGFLEVVEDHETGILVIPDNPDSVAYGILHTLNNPEWSAARVANAYRAARTRFSWDTIAEQTIAVYERIVVERGRVNW